MWSGNGTWRKGVKVTARVSCRTIRSVPETPSLTTVYHSDRLLLSESVPSVSTPIPFSSVFVRERCGSGLEAPLRRGQDQDEKLLSYQVTSVNGSKGGGREGVYSRSRYVGVVPIQGRTGVRHVVREEGKTCWSSPYAGKDGSKTCRTRRRKNSPSRRETFCSKSFTHQFLLDGRSDDLK